MPSIEYVSAKDIYIERETVRKPIPNMHRHRTYELYYLVRGNGSILSRTGFLWSTRGTLF